MNYGGLSIFSGLNLKLLDGKNYSIVGPTGCGKTTLLNIISGVDKPSSGELKFSGEENKGYLLQENVMLPWRTLLENIGLPFEIKQNVNVTNYGVISNFLKLFDLEGFETYYPDALSGGMKQRAALIRCLITEPNLLLLDEPFSNLDFDIKLKIQKILLGYQKQIHSSIVFVTHDIEDAIALSDEVIIFSSRPSSIKEIIKIDLGLTEKDPILARKSDKFPIYFAEIWDKLKY